MNNFQRAFWVCKRCAVILVDLCLPDPFHHPLPVCGCGQPYALFAACLHCQGDRFVQATRFDGADAGPCGECRATGVGSTELFPEDFE